MNTHDRKQVEELDKLIEEYLSSGKKLSEFIREHMFKEYSEGGDKKLEEIAMEYFLDHLK